MNVQIDTCFDILLYCATIKHVHLQSETYHSKWFFSESLYMHMFMLKLKSLAPSCGTFITVLNGFECSEMYMHCFQSSLEFWMKWAKHVSKCMSWMCWVGFAVFVVSGGFEESIFDINSHGLAVAAPPRGNGGSGSASDPTFPRSTWTASGGTFSPGTGLYQAADKPSSHTGHLGHPFVIFVCHTLKYILFELCQRWSVT